MSRRGAIGEAAYFLNLGSPTGIYRIYVTVSRSQDRKRWIIAAVEVTRRSYVRSQNELFIFNTLIVQVDWISPFASFSLCFLTTGITGFFFRSFRTLIASLCDNRQIQRIHNHLNFSQSYSKRVPPTHRYILENI